MTLGILPSSIQTLLVVGPIYNKIDKLQTIEKLLPQYDWVIFNDSIASLNNDTDHILLFMEKIDKLSDSGKMTYIKGSQDYGFIHSANLLDSASLKIESWLRTKPNVVMADFKGQYQLIVTSGGIPPHLNNLNMLEDNIEISFAPHPHQTYTGGLGYVICNSPLTKWAPKYYRYSVQLGNTKEGRVYALNINSHGIRRTILV